jgi:hypothetical protein
VTQDDSFCPRCGWVRSPVLRRCPNCNMTLGRLDEAAGVPCPSCGSPNPAGARFCIRCGKSMEAPLPARVPESESAPVDGAAIPVPPIPKRKPKSGRSVWLWPAVTFGVLVNGPLAYVMLVTSSGEPLLSIPVVFPGAAAARQTGTEGHAKVTLDIDIPRDANPLGGEFDYDNLCSMSSYDLVLRDPDGRTVWTDHGTPGGDGDSCDFGWVFSSFEVPPGGCRLEVALTWHQKEVPSVELSLRRNVTPLNLFVLFGLLALAFALPGGLWIVLRRRAT